MYIIITYNYKSLERTVYTHNIVDNLSHTNVNNVTGMLPPKDKTPR